MWLRKKPKAPKVRKVNRQKLDQQRDEMYGDIQQNQMFDELAAKHAYARVRAWYVKWFERYIDEHDPTQEV